MLFAARHRTSACARGGVIAWPAGVQGTKAEDRHEIHRRSPTRDAMIGESHPRLGGDRLASGAGCFVADVRVPGMLQAAVLRSSHAHARLVSVDGKRALGLPGVRAVLTAADVPVTAVIPNRVGAPPGTERYLQPAIARAVVRYAGEPVALVVADDRYVAEDALALIDVVYSRCPPAPAPRRRSRRTLLCSPRARSRTTWP